MLKFIPPHPATEEHWLTIIEEDDEYALDADDQAKLLAFYFEYKNSLNLSERDAFNLVELLSELNGGGFNLDCMEGIEKEYEDLQARVVPIFHARIRERLLLEQELAEIQDEVDEASVKA